MTNSQPRSTADLANLLGVKPATIRRYRAGNRYADHAFPEPDGHVGIAPYWNADRDDEIREWAETRVGMGAGGGQPAHKSKHVHHLDADPRNNDPGNLEVRDQPDV